MGIALLGAEVAVASLLLTLVVWFVVGAGNTARVQGTWTYVQGRFEPGVLARVTMNVYLFTGVASAIGAIVIGSLSTVWDPAMLTDLVSFGSSVLQCWGSHCPKPGRSRSRDWNQLSSSLGPPSIADGPLECTVRKTLAW